MTSKAGTLEQLARIVGEALRPLEQRVAGAASERLFDDLGVRLPEGFVNQASLPGALSSTVTAATQLAPALADLANAIQSSDPAQIILAGTALLQRIGDTLGGVTRIASGLDEVADVFPGLSLAQKARIKALAFELRIRLVNLLLVEWIEAKAPALVSALGVTDILDDTPEDGDPADPTAPPFARRALRFDQIGLLLSNPPQYLQTSFGWGQSDFNGLKLFQRIATYVRQAGLPATILTPPGQPMILEAGLFRLTVDPVQNPPGLSLRLRTPATTDFSERIPLLSPWALVVNTTGRFEAGLDITIQTSGAVSLTPPMGTTASLGLRSSLEAGDGTTPFTLLGQTGASRIEATLIKAALSFNATSNSSSEPFVQAEIAGGKVVIDPSPGDGFLTHLTSGLNLQAGFDFRITWTPSAGARFEGSSGLEKVIPTHFAAGPIEVSRIYLRSDLASGDGLSLQASARLQTRLGPLNVAIDKVGFEALLSFPNEGGNLGPANFNTNFKSPSGIDVTVDAASITGGGSLSFDPDKGQYSGWLHLKAQDIDLNAFGLLDTKLPGGESGFSFLILIATTFNPPIQLGLGFALRGVGGLVGINRDVKTEVLQAGLRSHTLDHLLFPENAERDAPLIISDLRAVFPPREGSYVFGPLAIITWAELIEAELGLVLHIADSVRLILLGQIRALIPKEEPILKLRLDIVGVLDFDQKLLDIRSTIYDSSVAGYPLSGEAALLLRWGNDPVFVFAIGGLHPDFSPPPGFPKLAPLTLALSDSDNPRLTLKIYLAVTSNTIQVGAEAELSARGGGFTLYGMLKFDALIDLSSFTFKINFKVKVELRRGSRVFAGIRLKATLTGPGEWHIWGEACISLFFFDICVDFDETFGDPVALILRKLINPFFMLRDAIQLGRNWSAALPPLAFRGVTTVPPEDGDQMAPGQKQTFVDPMGVVTLDQNVIPLNRKIAKFGEGKVDGPDRYNVTRVTIGNPAPGPTPVVPTPVNFSMAQGLFAPGQFEFLSDAQKLSRPSFEKMDSGVAIGSQAVKFGANCESEIKYETIILDSPIDRRGVGFYRLAGDSYLAMSETGAAARGQFQTTGDLKFAPAPRLPSFVALIGDEYVVASTNDLSVRADIIGDPVTKGAAFLALDDYLAAHPTERGRLQVVPRHELAGGSI